MYPITVKFARFEDISFAEVLRGTGVYVIWDSQARVRPSYIGKGDILSRLSSHDSKFAFPVRGYLAIIGTGGMKAEDKDAMILEALLLEVAYQTDRWPIHNKKFGGVRLLQRVFDAKGVVRVTIKGCDPFGPPHAPRYLSEPKHIWFELDNNVDINVHHDWNHRKRSTQ
jgi:hypothetical protein